MSHNKCPNSRSPVQIPRTKRSYTGYLNFLESEEASSATFSVPTRTLENFLQDNHHPSKKGRMEEIIFDFKVFPKGKENPSLIVSNPTFRAECMDVALRTSKSIQIHSISYENLVNRSQVTNSAQFIPIRSQKALRDTAASLLQEARPMAVRQC